MSAHGIEAAITCLTPQPQWGLRSWLETYHTQPGQPGFDNEQDHEQVDVGSDETEDVYDAAD